MTDNQTDDDQNQDERESFFATAGSKMVIGRFLAVGLFVALGTFAVIQSLRGDGKQLVDVASGATAGANSAPETAESSVVPASGQEEIPQSEKAPVSSNVDQFSKSSPRKFNPAVNSSLGAKTDSVKIPEVRSSPRKSQFGAPLSKKPLTIDASKKQFVASKPPTQDPATPTGAEPPSSGPKAINRGFRSEPPQGRIAQLDNGSSTNRFSAGASVKSDAGNTFKRAADAMEETVSKGAASASERFGDATAALKKRVDESAEKFREQIGVPKTSANVASQGDPPTKPSFSTGPIKPIEANSKLDSFQKRPFGTRQRFGTRQALGDEKDAANARFAAQPMTSISNASPAGTKPATISRPAARSNFGDRSLPPEKDRPIGARSFQTSTKTQGESASSDPKPTTGNFEKEPKRVLPPSRGFGPMDRQSRSTPAAIPTTPVNRASAPTIQASSVSAVPGDRRYDGVQATGLILQKSSPREIQVNETADFEINVKNVGRVELEDVRVVDKVPSGVEFIDSDPKPVSLGRMGDLQWNLGALKPGEERKIRVQLKPTRPGEIGSTAQVYSAARASMRTLVTQPKLKISHTADPKVLVGNNVVFDVVVENTGNGPAKDVIIQEEVPNLLEYQDGSRELEYEIGTLLPGQSRRVQLGLRAAKVGRLRNVMFASAKGGLQAKHEANVEIVAAKLETKSSGPTLRYIQRQVAHTFTVANIGTADATNLQLFARLPSGLRFVNADNRGRYDSNSHSVVWQMNEMKPGVNGNVELVTLPTGAGPQNIKFEAVADRNLKSSTMQELQIEHLVDIFIDIDDVIDPIEIGGNTSYRVRVANQGTQTAGNVQIQVDFPAGLQPTAVDGSLRNEIRGQQVLFEPITSLRPGDEIGVTIRATGKSSGDHRIAVNMKTEGRVTPVTKEETTKVYADR